jgi:nucleotide-binding universal stress UspA family protein
MGDRKTGQTNYQDLKNMKAILFPTDFSDCSRIAQHYAASLAVVNKAKLIIQTVFWVPIYEGDTTKEVKFKEESYRKKAKKALHDLKKEMECDYPEIQVECVINNGFLLESVMQVVKERRVDLIVMGTQGATGLKEVVIGSNTAEVMENAPCPVIAIPRKAKWNRFRKILYCMDYQETDLAQLEQLVNMVRRFDSEIIITHIAEGDYLPEAEKSLFKSFKELVNEFIGYKKIHFRLLENTDVKEEIEKYAEKEKAELIVLAHRKRSWLDKLISKGISRKLVSHSEIPVLVFKADIPKHMDNLHTLTKMSI